MKLKIQQYVTTLGGAEGKILDYTEKHDFRDGSSPGPAYKVQFTNKNLIPPTMWYPYEWLENCSNPEDGKCPVCSTEWLETRVIGKHVWRDCIPCGKKEEDILTELAEIPPIPKGNIPDWSL